MKAVVCWISLMLLMLQTGCNWQEFPLRVGVVQDSAAQKQELDALQDNLKSASFKLRGVATTGAEASFRLLQLGMLDAALVQIDELIKYVRDMRNDPARPPCFAAIGKVSEEVTHILVPRDSDLRSLDDLVDKRIAVLPAYEDSGFTARRILRANGITERIVKLSTESDDEAVQLMQEGKLDVMILNDKVPSARVTLLCDKLPLRLLAVDEDALVNLMHYNLGYRSVAIEPGTYQGQSDRVKTLGVGTMLIAHQSVESEQVSNLLLSCFKLVGTISGQQGVPGAEDRRQQWERLRGSEQELDFLPEAVLQYQKEGVTVPAFIQIADTFGIIATQD